MLKHAIFHARRAASASILPIASAGILLASPAASLAQERDSVSVEVGDCVKLESRADRLACYDRHANEALSENGRATKDASLAPSTTNQTRTEAAGEAASAADSSGANAHDGRPSSVVTVTEQPQAEHRGELHGTIAALRKRLPNQYLITLENGQMWLQKPPQVYPLQVGDEVTLYPTHWGKAYRLTVEKLKGFIQVERVR